MTTQYTPTLKLALPVTGELSGTWGDVVNDNITSMVEQAIAGLATINTWTANAHTLTTANGTTSESRCAMLVLTDTGTALSGAATVICPTASKIYIVKNTSGQSATIKTAAGTGIAVPNGETMFVFCDGTNVVQAVTRIASADVDFAKLKGTGAVVVTNILDEDNMASDSATALATQQSIKAYVDSKVAAVDTWAEVLANGNTSGGTNVVVSSGDLFTSTDDALISGLTVGKGAGAVATNTAVGASALAANTSGSNNVAVGYRALSSMTTGNTCVAVGQDALKVSVAGTENTAVGFQSMLSTLTASANSALGLNTLSNNTTGNNNTAVGYAALQPTPPPPATPPWVIRRGIAIRLVLVFLLLAQTLFITTLLATTTCQWVVCMPTRLVQAILQSA
jgi:hypothetical protein